MAIVPMTLQGSLNLGSVDTSNFIIENCFDGNFTTYSGNTADTPEGIELLKAYLATFFTGAMPNYPGGSVTTNEIAFDSDTKLLDINIIGEGDNEALFLPACIMVNQAEQNNNVVAFRFGSYNDVAEVASPGCTECYISDVAPCSDLNLALAFTPSIEYVVVKIDQFGGQQRFDKTSDDEGVIVFANDDFEEGENFNRAPSVRLYFYSAPTVAHSFVVGGKSYGCLVLNFIEEASDTAPDPLIAVATSV